MHYLYEEVSPLTFRNRLFYMKVTTFHLVLIGCSRLSGEYHQGLSPLHHAYHGNPQSNLNVRDDCISASFSCMSTHVMQTSCVRPGTRKSVCACLLASQNAASEIQCRRTFGGGRYGALRFLGIIGYSDSTAMGWQAAQLRDGCYGDVSDMMRYV